MDKPRSYYRWATSLDEVPEELRVFYSEDDFITRNCFFFGDEKFLKIGWITKEAAKHPAAKQELVSSVIDYDGED
jgi:hypothetical protein